MYYAMCEKVCNYRRSLVLIRSVYHGVVESQVGNSSIEGHNSRSIQDTPQVRRCPLAHTVADDIGDRGLMWTTLVSYHRDGDENPGCGVKQTGANKESGAAL